MANHAPLSNTILTGLDAASQTASANVQGAVWDMQGWDAIEFEFNIGAMANGATFTTTVFTSANANMSGNTVVNQNVNAVVTNANLNSVANGSNTNLFIVDCWKPSTRYVQAVHQPATANVTFSVTTRRYHRVGIVPPTQTATQIVSIVSN